MKPPRNDATSAPDTSLTLPGARLRLRYWRWKSSALVLIWRQMTCWSPQNSGERWPSANRCQLHTSAAFDTSLAWRVFLFARNVEGLWNGNTSPIVTAVGSALTGTTSLKQRLFCLRSNVHCYIPDHPASVLYLLAAFGMAFFSPQFCFISLLTFYLQTSSKWRGRYIRSWQLIDKAEFIYSPAFFRVPDANV